MPALHERFMPIGRSGGNRHGGRDMRKAALLIFVGLILAGGRVDASPWALPGDLQLRRDLEVLAAYGIIEGPITSWPLPWAQVSERLGSARGGGYPAHVMQAIERVRDQLPSARDYRGTGIEVEALGTNEPRVVRGFDGGARSEADVKIAADAHFSNTYVRLSLGYRNGAGNGKAHFENSYIAQAWGNWVFYGGLVGQWWGPGYDSALVHSTNARPMPKVGVTRLNPKPFGTKILSWMGPWQFNMYAARMESGRNDFAHPILFGMRYSFQPLRGLDIGFSRSIQLCGQSRPCGAKTWGKALVGVGNLDNTGTPNEPGNQLAAVDIRFARTIGWLDYSIYGELMGEDEDNYLIDRNSALFGGTLGGGFGEDGWSWQVRAEYSDTMANRIIGKNVFPGLTYGHGIYTDGYRFRGRSLGATLDVDSRLLTLGAAATDPASRYYWLRFRHADINSSDLPGRNPVSATREKISFIEGGATIPTRFGDFVLEFRIADDQPNTPGIKDKDLAGEFGWRTRF